MGVDDTINFNLEISDEELRKIEKAGADAEKRLREVSKKRKAIQRQEAKEPKFARDISKSSLGSSQIGRAGQFALDPAGGLEAQIISKFPILGSIATLPSLMIAINKELQKRGGLLDATFRDNVDTRVDVLRLAQDQQAIRAGRAQQIFTSSFTTDAIDAFNTYNEFNDNQRDLELKYAVRDVTGVL